MRVIDEKTLQVKHTLNWKRISIVLSIALSSSIIYNLSKEDIIRVHVRKIIHHDTILIKDMPLTDSAIISELVKLGCVLPNVALAQFRIETGHFTSAICKENKNIAGIRNSTSPLSIGKNRGHNVYATYRDCLKDYVRVQNKYLHNIDGHYAEAKGYIHLIKSMNK